MDKEETLFLENCTLVWSEFFLVNNLFMRLENLKTSLKTQPQIFLREKVSTFVFKLYIHFLTFEIFNYPL